MKTARISQGLNKALNHQMSLEAYASQIYLSYAAWMQSQGYAGIGNFLFRHSHEERTHMMKILTYILNRGGEVEVTEVAAPPSNPNSVQDCFEKIFAHEVENTQAVYRLVKMSFDESDWATWNLMQWFVKEQVEEENFALTLMDRLKISGGDDAGSNVLYELDRDLASAPGEFNEEIAA